MRDWYLGKMYRVFQITYPTQKLRKRLQFCQILLQTYSCHAHGKYGAWMNGMTRIFNFSLLWIRFRNIWGGHLIWYYSYTRCMRKRVTLNPNFIIWIISIYYFRIYSMQLFCSFIISRKSFFSVSYPFLSHLKHSTISFASAICIFPFVCCVDVSSHWII